MKKAINRLAGKGPKTSHDPEQEAARALEEARREAAARLGGSRVDPSASAAPAFHSPAPSPRPGLRAPSASPPAPPRQEAAPSPPRDFLGAAPPVAGSGSFGTPPSGGITPSDERRVITDMALEDLQRQRQAAAAAENPAVVRPARIPEDEYERRRPPAPGESLPGVPPPHIPSEDLRDQALREILERKERLDQEYRERQARMQAATGNGPAAPEAGNEPKSKLHGLARKRQAAAQAPPERAPSAAAKAPPAGPSSTTTTGESVEEALAAIKGVGPVIRSALLERFDSVQAIREADQAELIAVDGIGPALASRIKTSL